MKRIGILYTIFFIFFFISISCTGKPNIEFKEMSHDFGDVKQNQELTHVFVFNNTGSSTLIIEKVKAG